MLWDKYESHVACIYFEMGGKILYCARPLVEFNVNPLPHVPILGSSSSAVNKDMIPNIWTNEDTVT